MRVMPPHALHTERAGTGVAGLLPLLLDKHVGLIHSIEWHRNSACDPQLARCHARLADVSCSAGRTAKRIGSGVGLGQQEALSAAVGDAVKHYCVGLYRPPEMVCGYDEIGEAAIAPHRFALFSPEQYRAAGFPFAPVTEKSRVSWVRGFSLTRGEAVWLPLAAVVTEEAGRGELFDTEPVSGFACGRTAEEAIMRGLCEVVERDAFMLHWYNSIAPPPVDPRGCPLVWQILDRFHGVPAQLLCADLTADTGIPTMMTVLLGRRTDWPAVVLATAADFDPQAALRKALLQLASNLSFVRSLLKATPGSRPLSPQDIFTREDHALYYGDRRRLRDLEQFLHPNVAAPPPVAGGAARRSARQRVEDAVRRLAELDMEVTYIDLTTPDVEEVGLKVVKVIVPGAQPLDYGIRLRHLGGRRLDEAPARMGYEAARARDGHLNPLPHPCP